MTRALPSPISLADRALIDRHIAENGVTAVARGVSGFRDKDYTFGGKANLNKFRKGRKPNLKRQAQYRALAEDDKTIVEIAKAMGVTHSGAFQALNKLGLKAKPRRTRAKSGEKPARNGKADIRKAERADIAVKAVNDRRRFRTVPVPMGLPAKQLDPGHEAAKGARTIFPSRVFDPIDGESVLKDGASNSKIGGDVLIGWLKGARIVTLTLEERATCPKSCPLWLGCYGNTMQWSRRWKHGPELEARIQAEIADLCARHKRVLVRLHVLGDFYNLDYVSLWLSLMQRHEGLACFGFTAWGPETKIGELISHMRAEFGRRWSIRHSGRTGPWGSFTIDFPTEKKRIGDALVCPEQRAAMNGSGTGTHCGSCAACWSSDVPIVFVEH